MHYERWRRGKPLDLPRLVAARSGTCTEDEEDCDSDIYARRLCSKHYSRRWRAGRLSGTSFNSAERTAYPK